MVLLRDIILAFIEVYVLHLLDLIEHVFAIPDIQIDTIQDVVIRVIGSSAFRLALNHLNRTTERVVDLPRLRDVS